MTSEMLRIRRLVLEGEPLERIEAEIDAMALTTEAKVVLWLFAWAGADPLFIARELGCPLRLPPDGSLSVG